MIGHNISHYRILEKLGEGGMGVVFLAEDTRLDREVALKFLPPATTVSEEDRKRFEQEARAAARLNHPNICTIHAFDEHEGRPYLVMEYVEGETLRERMGGEALPTEEVLDYARQIAAGLDTAHASGIVHRDIKPGNIMVTADGRIKVMDFGLAKLRGSESITRTGSTVGTMAYMAPEQILGRTVDGRADIFAFGVMLFEMLTGMRPFEGEHEPALVYSILHEEPSSLNAYLAEPPPELERLIEQMLQKDAEERPESLAPVINILERVSRRSSGEVAVGPRASWTPDALVGSLRRPRVLGLALAALIVVAAGAAWLVDRQSTIRWARVHAPVEVERLMHEHKYASAFALARLALDHLPNDPTLERLLEGSSVPVSIDSEPAGARFFYKPFLTPEEPWKEVGTTPLEDVLLPRQHLRWRLELDGYAPREGTFPTLWRTLNEPLLPAERAVDGMVWIPAGAVEIEGQATRLDEFWIDRYEVSNREYARFVRGGGYEDESLWTDALQEVGIIWEEARGAFRDLTGRPGPAGWDLQEPPPGTEDLPVTGISWLEALAFCNFAGKQLPTVYHWRRAAGRELYADIQKMSNFSGEGLAPAGTYRGMSRYGVYDMAGNAKEWTWTASGDRRYILGGAWNEPEYMYPNDDSRLPQEREETFGVRCMQAGSQIPEALLQPVETTYHDFTGHQPVDDGVFEIVRRMFDYVPGPLEAREERVSEAPLWRRETVTFNAAYGSERVLAHLFFPHDAEPPYQTVIYFPGTNALLPGSSETPNDLALIDFLMRSGRVLVYPVYKYMYERAVPDWTPTVTARRQRLISWSHDVGRTLDYLESRGDIDTATIAFFGLSLGATAGPVIGAVNERLHTLVLLAGGLASPMLNDPPELFPLNFAPHVHVPVLKIGGRDDFTFGPSEMGRQPLFELFGTPDEHKRFALLDGAHIPEWREVIRETLDWLDRYQAPIRRTDSG